MREQSGHVRGVLGVGSRQQLERTRLQAIGIGIGSIAVDGVIEQRDRFAQGILAGFLEVERRCSEEQILGRAVGGAAKCQRGTSPLLERHAECFRDISRDVGLYLDRVARPSIVALGPALDSVGAADQLRANADQLCRAANATTENVGDSQHRRRGLGIKVLDRVGRCPANHLETDTGQGAA